MSDIARLILKNKSMFTGMKGNPSARVTLARGLKIARFNKKICPDRATPSLGSTKLQNEGKL